MMPEASKSNIHGYIHGKMPFAMPTPEGLKKFRAGHFAVKKYPDKTF
jgi:hypothetical protein